MRSKIGRRSLISERGLACHGTPVTGLVIVGPQTSLWFCRIGSVTSTTGFTNHFQFQEDHAIVVIVFPLPILQMKWEREVNGLRQPWGVLTYHKEFQQELMNLDNLQLSYFRGASDVPSPLMDLFFVACNFYFCPMNIQFPSSPLLPAISCTIIGRETLILCFWCSCSCCSMHNFLSQLHILKFHLLEIKENGRKSGEIPPLQQCNLENP